MLLEHKMIWDGMDAIILNVVRGWSNVQRTIYYQMWNYKGIMNLNSKCSYLVCSTCYNENGSKCSEAGHVTCPKWHVIRCEMVKRVCIQKGHHMPSIALVILIIVIIAKNGTSKTMINYILPGSVLHIDSESAVIISNLSPYEVL